MSTEERKTTRPTNCPKCSGELRDTRVGMSRKAKWVRYSGMALSPLWFMAAWWMAGLGYFDWMDRMGESAKETAGLVLFFAPLAIGLILSSTFARVLPYECFACGWKQEFEVESE